MKKAFGSEQDEMNLSISEVSELTGITQSNLRFFEEEGILDIPRNGAGHRIFFRKEMEELLGLVCLKQAGMELKEIKKFFHLTRQGNATLQERYRMLRDSYEAMEFRIRELQRCLNYSKIKMDFIGKCSDAYLQGKPLPQVDPQWMNSFLDKKNQA